MMNGRKGILDALLRTTLAVIAGSAAITGQAVFAAWTSTGPEGGRIESIVYDPSDTDTVYVAAGTGGIWKSTDGGATWAPATSGLESQYASCIAVDPANPMHVLAGAFPGGVYSSTNGGATWKHVASVSNVEATSIVADRTRPGTFFIGSYGRGVLKSTNGGTSWTQINSGLGSMEISRLLLDESSSQHLYAGTWEDAGFFRSLDAGKSWEGGPLPNVEPVQDFAIWSGASPTILAATRWLIYRGTSGVGGWTGVGMANKDTRVIAADPNNTGTAYAGTYGNGIYRTTNTGTSWKAVNKGLADRVVWALTVHPSSASVVMAGTAGGLYRSSNSGASWGATNSGLNASTIRSLRADPEQPGSILAGSDSGLYSSNDFGATWSRIHIDATDFYSDFVYALAGDSSNTRLYAGTWAGVYRSLNRGRAWKEINKGIPATRRLVLGLAVDHTDSRVVYAAVIGGGVFKSTNGGESWNSVNVGLPAGLSVHRIMVDPTSAGTLYCLIYGSGIYKSTNGGTSWLPANGGIGGSTITISSLAADPSATGTLYAGTSSGVFKSTNGGASWKAAVSGLPSNARSIVAILVDSTAPKTVYLAAGGAARMYRSTDSGAHWKPYGSGMETTRPAALAQHSTTGGTLYAATAGQGVWRYDATAAR